MFQVDLAKVMSEERSYDVFRRFLANIICVENLDFVTIVQQYRAFASAVPDDGVGSTDRELLDASHESQYLNPQHSRKANSCITKMSTLQLVEELVVQEGAHGKTTIDITRLRLDFVPVDSALENAKDVKAWVAWIYTHYISNDGRSCVNISAKSRRVLEKKCKTLLEEESNVVTRVVRVESDPATTAGRTATTAGGTYVAVCDDLNVAALFDDVQMEIWKLMAQDSMVHFRNSTLYAQVFWNEEETETSG